MVTNLTNLTNAQTFYDLVEYSNDVTSGLITQLFVVSVFIILFVMFNKRYDSASATLASGFICLGLSMALTAINLLNFYNIILFGIIVAFAAFILQFSKH